MSTRDLAEELRQQLKKMAPPANNPGGNHSGYTFKGTQAGPINSGVCICIITKRSTSGDGSNYRDGYFDTNGNIYALLYTQDTRQGNNIHNPVPRNVLAYQCRVANPQGLTADDLVDGMPVTGQCFVIPTAAKIAGTDAQHAFDKNFLVYEPTTFVTKATGLKIKNAAPDTAIPWALMQVTGMGYDGGSDDPNFFLIVDYPDKLDFGTPSSEWPTNYAWSYLWGHKFLINDAQPLPSGEFKLLQQTDPCLMAIDETDPRDWSLGHTISIDGGSSWLGDIDAGETTPYMSMGVTNTKKGGDGVNYNVVPVSLIGSQKAFTCGYTQKVGDGFATQYTIDTPNATVIQWTFPQGNQSSKYFTTVGDDGDDLQKWKFQQGGSYLVTILLRVRGIKRDSTIDNNTKPAKCWLNTQGSFPSTWGLAPNTLGNNALVATTQITKTPRLENPSAGVYSLEFDYDEVPILAILPLTFIVGNAQVDETFWLEITNQDADGTYLPLEIMWSGLTVVKIS